ncbi:hypothetical protein E7744_09350 [Citricoccus sp. SGAir0253]|uniref:hypothetical protein n=1 Tax=Citricoccus sp. SGAir0253 TaxID=2567881 RepID=UPI0010CCB3FC|nr:hypothetical protein [Citricoccus sp. SGAir0253]QCU78347.1 hypothetical protein E7744_09350 [Citricoccus sp. SGAir0253]
MSEFVIAIPTLWRPQLEEKRSSAWLRERLERTAVGYAPFLGPDLDPVPEISEPAARGTLAVLSFVRRGESGRVQASGDHWSVSAGSPVSAQLLDSLYRHAGRLVYDLPVWGQYAAVFGERYLDRVTAWNTVPALEAIHYAVTDEYVFLGNRPLLVAMAMAAGARSALSLSTDYLTEYLLYGYSLSGQTPFTGVRTLSVDRSLCVHRGEVSLHEVPSGLTGPLSARHTLEEGTEALAAALTSAMDRTERALDGRRLQLRLSGGKDSRVMLALLRGRDLDVGAVTFGREGDADVRLARLLAHRSGVRHEVRFPELGDAADLAGQVALTIAGSGGIPASEPHTARYRGADAGGAGEGIMLGQWPLTKGGMAKRLRYPAGGIESAIMHQGGSLVGEGARAPLDDRLQHWFNSVHAASELEKLYLFAREFRSGRYLHAHIAHYAGEAQIAYPISDAEVAAVCDALTMPEKVSERALFGALSRLWPEVMELPLDRSVWRFEAAGPDPEFSGPHYEARSTPLPPAEEDPHRNLPTRPSEFSGVVAAQLAREILDSDRAPLFASLLTAEMWAALTPAAAGHVQAPASMSRLEFVKYLWRVYVADVWLSRRWIPA